MARERTARHLMSGWCEAKNCHKCPSLLRKHRYTPKGVELQERRCPCPCHRGEAR